MMELQVPPATPIACLPGGLQWCSRVPSLPPCRFLLPTSTSSGVCGGVSEGCRHRPSPQCLAAIFSHVDADVDAVPHTPTWGAHLKGWRHHRGAQAPAPPQVLALERPRGQLPRASPPPPPLGQSGGPAAAGGEVSGRPGGGEGGGERLSPRLCPGAAPAAPTSPLCVSAHGPARNSSPCLSTELTGTFLTSASTSTLQTPDGTGPEEPPNAAASVMGCPSPSTSLLPKGPPPGPV
mmetsp:Transcript_67289/g.166169  ORF Transcript_67289/g.166169 Transcript_67289/m.166169 type:complete len:236 (+) Transcript_67289:686-1393(+)